MLKVNYEYIDDQYIKMKNMFYTLSEGKGFFYIILELQVSHKKVWLAFFDPLTLKGRGYFTNKKDGGGGIMAPPPVISARSNGKRLIFSGY